MKTTKGIFFAIAIICFLLLISACQMTSNQANDKQIISPSMPISNKMRKQLVHDAKQATKEKRFSDAIRIADTILKARPDNKTALALKENAQALQEDYRHEKVMAHIDKVNSRERNKYLENLKEKLIPYNDLMQFTTEEEWERVKERVQREDVLKYLEEEREHTERLKRAPSPSQKFIPPEMRMKLDEKLSIEFINTPLRDVISFLQEKTKMNFFLDKQAEQVIIDIKLHDVPLSVILEYLLPKGLDYIVKDNIVHITVEPLELRVYDIRDLLINLEDRHGMTTQTSAPGSDWEASAKGESKDTFDRVREIIDLITNTIEPVSWLDNGGKGMIAAREGMLGDIVVTHTLDIHKRVEDLLSALRSSVDLQINIEARFIAVSDNFLEAYGNNINEFDITQGADDPKRRGIFNEAGDAFVDTGTTSALGATTGLNLTYQIFDGLFLKGFLKAVQESDEAETVTAPKITLSNTQRGTIKVVTTKNYIESYTIVSQTPQPVIGQIDDGTTFNVRPVVSADRKYVYLEVHPVITTVTFDTLTYQTAGQTVSDTTNPVAQNTVQLPQTVKQELAVTVCVPDKGILMIGGLGKRSNTKSSKGVPIFSQIPLIKRLFSSDTIDKDINLGDNLIILIKPTILIRNEEETRAFAKEKRDVKNKFPTYGK